jgi:hypothetical protein
MWLRRSRDARGLGRISPWFSAPAGPWRAGILSSRLSANLDAVEQLEAGHPRLEAPELTFRFD